MATRRAFAQEDTNLQTATVATSRVRQYKDIDLSFTAKPSGEIFKKTDAAAVKQAVKTILLTNFLEKPFRPDFGGNFREELFELATDNVTQPIVREKIIKQIQRHEPRAEITNVDVKLLPDQNQVAATIEFRIVNTEEVVSFTTTLSRLR